MVVVVVYNHFKWALVSVPWWSEVCGFVSFIAYVVDVADNLPDPILNHLWGVLFDGVEMRIVLRGLLDLDHAPCSFNGQYFAFL